MLHNLILASLLATSAAWSAVPRPSHGALVGRRARATQPLLAADGEGETWSFGDAAEVSEETQVAMQVEEREMTEKEKEIARLRAAEKFIKKDTGDATCRTCNYQYKWEQGVEGKVPKKTPFELVPDSFTCPNCKSPKAFFDPVQIEIAGFADNQNYGFGTNTWTEGEKSNAIFGGFAFFFLLLIAGYGLN